MLYNYLKIVIRNTIRDGMYNFIIVFGLAMGIGATLIIAQYIQFELSFDKEYKDDDQTYMANMRWLVKNDGASFDIECHPAIAPLLEGAVPEVEFAARMVPVSFNSGHEWVLRKLSKGATAESFIRGDYLFYADASLLDIFSIKLLKGDARTALKQGNTVVLSERMANTLFPHEEALGQTIQLQSYGSMRQFEVVGVAETPARNSTMQFNVLMSLKSFPPSRTDEVWSHPAYRTYVKVRPGSNIAEVERKINKAAQAYLRVEEEVNGISQQIRFYPFSRIHFYEPYADGGGDIIRFSGDKRLLFYFGILAGLILVISWANYINLTTARALRRAKEVGLRKVNGAASSDLIKQFLIEYLFMNLISMMLAFTIAQLFFSTFAMAIGSKAEWTLWSVPLFWVVIVMFLIISTFASGLYPAFVLAGYNPAKVLKGNFSNSSSGSSVRKGLVIVQFSLSVLLLISIYVISSQIFFMKNKDLGQSAEKVVVINAMEIDTAISRTDAYLRWKTRISQSRVAKSTAAAGVYPGQSEMLFLFFRRPSQTEQRIGLQTYHVSEGYLKSLNIALLYGRDFDDERPGELDKLIISKKSALDLGFTNIKDAIGEKLKLVEGDELFEIIGVTNDFTTSMKMPLFTHALRYKYFMKGGDHFNYFIVKLENGNATDGIANLKSEWASLFPDTPFDYFFLSNFFNTLYKDEYQFASVFGFFSVIGVIITCMGLYGLSLFNTSIRTKEIGIRKSLGGSVGSIMWLFSRDYLKLIVVASVLALPIGIWQLDNWLSTYPNRISLGADVALFPVLIVIAISGFTVGYHTYKAASTSPVKSLRAE